MIPRRALTLVQDALNRQAAVALIGPRQVGKTTLAHMIAAAASKPALYLDLEAREDREKLSDPALFLRRYEDRLVILDEIHRAPELFAVLRGLIDQGRRRGLRHATRSLLDACRVKYFTRHVSGQQSRPADLEQIHDVKVAAVRRDLAYEVRDSSSNSLALIYAMPRSTAKRPPRPTHR